MRHGGIHPIDKSNPTKTHMKILITGASGFVGKYLVDLLLKSDGIEVVCIDRMPSLFDANPQVEHIKADLNDMVDENDLLTLADVTVVIHLAASRTDWGISIEKFHNDNVKATDALCELLKHTNAKKVIHYSTVAVLEFVGTTLNATDYTKQNAYGLSKYLSEKALTDYCGKNAIELDILRPSAIFGPNQPTDTNTRKLFDMCTSRFPLIPSTQAKKSITSLENICIFTKDRAQTLNGGIVSLTIERPVLTVHELSKLIVKISGTKKLLVFIPKAALMLMGYIFDAASFAVKKDLKFSSVRVKKYYKDTSFDDIAETDNYARHFSIEDAIERTMTHGT